jgi:hypothetical protein
MKVLHCIQGWKVAAAFKIFYENKLYCDNFIYDFYVERRKE